MKRRNVDVGKPPRRPTKRSSKFTDSVYGSSFVYLKFIVVWLFILLADFILEFRFEYIWPLWLLLQSVYETFKYQGLVYSVFFVCIAITSDTICLLFIPIQWLFFMASTYVWIHYVWHTDRGICFPTVSLWLFIMYIETTVRLRDLKSSQLHIDLCQPFAAHCIGHPVVTLGIGIKSYVIYRLRIRTQRQVQNENNFYYELLKYALPRKHHNHTLAVTEKERRSEEVSSTSLSNGAVSNHSSNKKSHEKYQKSSSTSAQDNSLQIAELSTVNSLPKHSPNNNNSGGASATSNQRKQNTNSHTPVKSIQESFQVNPSGNASPDMELKRRSTSQSKKLNANSGDSPLSATGQHLKGSRSSSGNNSPKSGKQVSVTRSSVSSITSESEKHKNAAAINNFSASSPSLSNILTNGHVLSDKIGESKVELISTPSVIEKLEMTIAKLRAELTTARKSESDLKSQIDHWMNMERLAKSELAHLKKENESLQMRLQTLVTCKQKDKQIIQSMEKRLKTEVDNREFAEKMLFEEKRRRKEEEENASRAAAAVAQRCREKEAADVLIKAKKNLQVEMELMQINLRQKEEECNGLKKEVLQLQVQDKSIKESETLMSALEAMQEKNALLEKSLSAETRLKLDLFSALGDVKRQLELAHGIIYKRDAEIADLKARMSDILSILPEQRLRSPTPHYSTNFLEKPMVQISPTQEYANAFCSVPRPPRPPVVQGPAGMDQQAMMNHLQPVHLDPNAAMYTPNTSGV
ncbi:macoilin-like [Clavelina lepadiformis]|uniref:macoilin-like n=1 Tax=Clavelina lepadiformis TaxID=159417 RepID=UPI004041C760